MFFIRHPKPVVDPRAVAMLVVQQKATREVPRTVLVVDKPATAPTVPGALPAQGKPDAT